MKKTIYKTVYTIEVLTEENETYDYDLDGLAYEITNGDASGHLKTTMPVAVVGKDAVKECEKHGTDPEFFGMDKDGNVLSDYIDDMLNDRFDELTDQEN